MALPPATRLAVLLFAAALSVPAAVSLMAWRALDPGLRAALAAAGAEQGPAIAFLGLIALVALWTLLHALARGALGFAPRLAHALDVLRGANPRLRVEADAGVPAELAAAANALADHYERQSRDVERRVAETTAALEQERDLLAGLLAEAKAALLVCSMDGRILLYNARARSLLRGALPDEAFVGLGRSVFGLFRRSAILHGLERLQAALDRGEVAPTATALINTRRGVTLRAQFTPLQGERRRGFILTLTDVSAGIEGGAAEGRRWRRFAETARARLAGARAALEVLDSVPDLTEADRARFLHAADTETAALGAALESADRDAAAAARDAALLEEIAGETLLELLRRPLQEQLPFPVAAALEDPKLWLRADSYSLAAALRFVVTQLSQAYPLRELRLRLTAVDGHAAIDLSWSGTGLLPPPLWQLCTESPITLGDDVLPYSVQDVARRHGGEMWQQAESADGARLRLLLPQAEPAAAAPAPPVEPSRPEFYAFDLFESRPEEPVRQARLRDLICTAFDTETTGLDPETDAIIAIGAIRVVKGRILSQEAFETLVATDRPIAPEALRIHGIRRSDLRGQPGIAEALPRFHRFCEDTVLVGHNVAFDLRFLQVLEAATGVRFRNLVLDTLLLSAVLLPEREAHALDAVAARLGVPVLGRHTALGDAILAAEVFVRLVPLLEARGIATVAAALDASQQTWHARLRY